MNFLFWKKIFFNFARMLDFLFQFFFFSAGSEQNQPQEKDVG